MRSVGDDEHSAKLVSRPRRPQSHAVTQSLITVTAHGHGSRSRSGFTGMCVTRVPDSDLCALRWPRISLRDSLASESGGLRRREFGKLASFSRRGYPRYSTGSRGRACALVGLDG